jgi:hypothetical protein
MPFSYHFSVGERLFDARAQILFQREHKIRRSWRVQVCIVMGGYPPVSRVTSIASLDVTWASFRRKASCNVHNDENQGSSSRTGRL